MNVENAKQLIEFLQNEVVDLPPLPTTEEKETPAERLAQYDENYFFSLPNFIQHLFHKKEYCGTICCIAGAVRVMEQGKNSECYHYSNILIQARDFLGINGSAATALFSPDIARLTDNYYHKSDIQRKHAIIVLTKMIWRHEDEYQGFIDGDVVRRFWVDALKGVIS